MPTVVDLARPASRPTRGQYVNILQSTTEAEIPSNANMDDTLWGTLYAAQGAAMPVADDRAHQTGDDAIAFGSNLITDTFVSWTVVGNVVDEAGSYRFQGTTDGEASIKQSLSSEIVAGNEVRVEFDFDHDAGSLLDVFVQDGSDIYILEGVVGGTLPSGSSHHVHAAVLPATTAAAVYLRDRNGDMLALVSNVEVKQRAQSL